MPLAGGVPYMLLLLLLLLPPPPPLLLLLPPPLLLLLLLPPPPRPTRLPLQFFSRCHPCVLHDLVIATPAFPSR